MIKMKSISLALFLIHYLTACQVNEGEAGLVLKELSISEIHKAYVDGSYNSLDLVEGYLSAIDEIDGQINAITVLNKDVRNIANALDKEYQRTKVLRPLHGIPIIVKDNINTVGMPTTAGSLALRDFIPEKNAFIIDKLVEAGAIILAKSNMAEWAFSAMHTESST
ncbi:MAG TPA: amidase, partial [Pricia sp.]|nr:amidase [Pricia sp.]